MSNNPLIRVDPSGHDSYVLYTTNPHSNFEDQADFQKKRLEEAEETVHMIEINSVEDFEKAWNSLGTVDGKSVNINEVLIISHTQEDKIILEEGTSDNAFSMDGLNSKGDPIGNLNELKVKKITALTLLTCNAGHVAVFESGVDNLATFFLREKMIGNGVVYAYDGNVVFGSKWSRWWTGNLYSRLSSEQKTHYSILKEYNAKKRKPYGKVMFSKDSAGEVKYQILN